MIAYVSWTESKLAVYDLKGNLFSEIHTDDFYKNNEEIELNSIVSIVNENIIFDATDYSMENEKQIRVLYNVAEKAYKVYNSSFVMDNGECY